MKGIAALMCAAMLASGAAAEEIDYDALFHAIAMVESDDGLTSSNRYQLTEAYCRDLERITNERWDYAATIADDERARLGMRIYWAYYTPRRLRLVGGRVDAKTLAQLHRVGYGGMESKRQTADLYWLRVCQFYNEAKNAKIKTKGE